jgi:lactoylglutathione lyase
MGSNPGFPEAFLHLVSSTNAHMIAEADKSSTGPASFMIVDPDGNTILVDQHV